MNTYTYIKNDIFEKYITLNEELDNKSYSIGSTYEDYLNGKWVLLSAEQISFAEKNPSATIKEIWDMKITPVNIELIRSNKINDLMGYDKSQNVNSFILNGYSVWVDRETRVSLMTTTQIKKQLGEEETTIWFENYSFTMSCDMVIQMLSQVEMYAYDCFNQTAKHKSAILLLDNIEDIQNYDFTIGYPEKINLTIESI